MWLSLYLGDESYAIDEYEIYTECESWYKKLAEVWLYKSLNFTYLKRLKQLKKVISVVELY